MRASIATDGPAGSSRSAAGAEEARTAGRHRPPRSRRMSTRRELPGNVGSGSSPSSGISTNARSCRRVRHREVGLVDRPDVDQQHRVDVDQRTSPDFTHAAQRRLRAQAGVECWRGVRSISARTTTFRKRAHAAADWAASHTRECQAPVMPRSAPSRSTRALQGSEPIAEVRPEAQVGGLGHGSAGSVTAAATPSIPSRRAALACARPRSPGPRDRARSPFGHIAPSPRSGRTSGP